MYGQNNRKSIIKHHAMKFIEKWRYKSMHFFFTPALDVINFTFRSFCTRYPLNGMLLSAPPGPVRVLGNRTMIHRTVELLA